jgi:hypothetical protein
LPYFRLLVINHAENYRRPICRCTAEVQTTYQETCKWSQANTEQAPKFVNNERVKISGETHPPLRVYDIDMTDKYNINYFLALISESETEENAVPVLWKDGAKIHENELEKLVDAGKSQSTANL